MNIVAMPKTYLDASRGYPTVFDPKSLIVTPDDYTYFIHCFTLYIGELPDAPKWWLSSYLSN